MFERVAVPLCRALRGSFRNSRAHGTGVRTHLACQPRKASIIGRFARNQRGSVYTMGAVMAVPLIGLFGVGVDSGLAYFVRNKLHRAVDSATLAGGKVMYEKDYKRQVTEFYRTNFPDGYLGTSLKNLKITKTGGDSDRIQVSAQVRLPTAFMHLLGIDHVIVGAQSEVIRKNSYLNIALAIDMSGSMKRRMGSSSRIAAARDAAKAMVDVLYEGKASQGRVKVGIVPWNGLVNITKNGTTYEWWRNQQRSRAAFTHPRTRSFQNHIWTVTVSPVPLLDEPDEHWKGCVRARFIKNNTEVDDADTHERYRTAVGWVGWEPRQEGEWVAISPTSPLQKSDRRTPARAVSRPRLYAALSRAVRPGALLSATGAARSVGRAVLDLLLGHSSAPGLSAQFRRTPPRTKIIAGKPQVYRRKTENTECLDHGITPLNQDKGAVKSAIDELKKPNGVTVMVNGLGWAWRLVTPETPFSEADKDEPQKEVVRAVVLLTDGAHYAGPGDAYGQVLDRKGKAKKEYDKRLLMLAARMKKQGILIYTIQFGTSAGKTAKVLKQAASGAGSPFYHFAPDAAALKKVFKDIATSLSELRITK